MKFIIFYCSSGRVKINPDSLTFHFFKNYFLLSTKSSIIINFFLIFFRKKTRIILCDGEKPKTFFKIKTCNLWFNTPLELIENDYSKNDILSDKNYYVCHSPLFKGTQNFNLGPAIKKKFFYFNSEIKIVYCSEVTTNISEIMTFFWKQKKEIVMNDFSILNDINFLNELPGKNNFEKMKNYIELKNLLRFEIISILYKRFENNILLIGTDWKKYGFKSIQKDFKKSVKRKLYNRNICLDLGAKSGANSFYPRTIDILDYSGFLLQIKPFDKIEGSFENYKIFNSMDDLITILEDLLKQSNKKIECEKLNNFLNDRFHYNLNNIYNKLS